MLADGEPSLQHTVLKVCGAGVGGTHEHEDPAACVAGGLDERSDGVTSKQRVQRERVGAKPLDLAVGRGRRAEEGLPIGGRRDVDVAALGVGDHEQAAGPRPLHGLLQRRPARRAETLETGDLQLGRDNVLGHRLDHERAVGRDGESGTPRGLLFAAAG